MAETPFSPEPSETRTESETETSGAAEAADQPETPATEPPATSEPAEPTIAATLEVPPVTEQADATEAEGGGEFELLLQKVRDWFASGELQAQWQRIRGPLKGVAILIAVVLVLRLYASLVGTLDSLPLFGGLLELVGLIALIRFSMTRLVRRTDREQLMADWSKRWKEFRGKV